MCWLASPKGRAGSTWRLKVLGFCPSACGLPTAGQLQSSDNQQRACQNMSSHGQRRSSKSFNYAVASSLAVGNPRLTDEGLPFVKMISLPCFRSSSPLRYSSPLTAYSAPTKSSLRRSGCKTYTPTIPVSQLCMLSAVSSVTVCVPRQVCSISRLEKDPRRHYVHDFMSMYPSTASLAGDSLALIQCVLVPFRPWSLQGPDRR